MIFLRKRDVHMHKEKTGFRELVIDMKSQPLMLPHRQNTETIMRQRNALTIQVCSQRRDECGILYGPDHYGESEHTIVS